MLFVNLLFANNNLDNVIHLNTKILLYTCNLMQRSEVTDK